MLNTDEVFSIKKKKKITQENLLSKMKGWLDRIENIKIHRAIYFVDTRMRMTDRSSLTRAPSMVKSILTQTDENTRLVVCNCHCTRSSACHRRVSSRVVTVRNRVFVSLWVKRDGYEFIPGTVPRRDSFNQSDHFEYWLQCIFSQVSFDSISIRNA